MYRIFLNNSPYKNRARFLATLWTLLIFILCLMPGNDLPEVNVPFIDKWTHFVLFGTFTFLWLCGFPKRKFGHLALIFIISIALGWLIECLQGYFTSLGRDKDIMDAIADGIGGLLGVLFFTLLSSLAEKKQQSVNNN
ncbi:MAG: VanZ family protein [Bacteroidetes bacterium]|nr:VanZ family protein [Bacteroidota bacterium]